MSAPPASLTKSQRVEFLTRLRDARALVLRDGESFREASTVLEHIGQVIGGKMGNGLKDHEEAIVGLAKEAEQTDEQSISRLFNVVREARNKAVHDGAYARHLNGRLLDLLLLLEEAIMTNMDRVEDLMVRNPVSAEPWHLVSHVRKMMLTNSFSCLPRFKSKTGKDRWMLLQGARKSYDERLTEIKQGYPKAYQPWTRDEDVRLTERFRFSASVKELAAEFQRQPSAIRSRLAKLGLGPSK